MKCSKDHHCRVRTEESIHFTASESFDIKIRLQSHQHVSRDKALMRLLLLYCKVIKSLKKRISKKICKMVHIKENNVCLIKSISMV